ncbi:MAG: hypothetical protein V4662_18325, partial [Verrucomicrobiota bacterium]
MALASRPPHSTTLPRGLLGREYRDSVVECGDERSGAAPLWAGEVEGMQRLNPLLRDEQQLLEDILLGVGSRCEPRSGFRIGFRSSGHVNLTVPSTSSTAVSPMPGGPGI